MTDYAASNYPSLTAPTRKMIDEKGQRLRTSPSKITTTVAALPVNDRILFCKIPSNARMVDIGKFSYSAFGGAAAMSLGFDHPNMTSGERTAAASKLFSAQSVVAAGSRQVMAGVATTDLDKKAWQLAGLTADPGGELDIVGTVTTIFAAVGTMYIEPTWTKD